MGQVLAPSLGIRGSHWLPSLTSPVGPMLQPLTLLSPKQLCVPQCALGSRGASAHPTSYWGPGESAHLFTGQAQAQESPPGRHPLRPRAPQFLVQRPPPHLKSSVLNCAQQGGAASRPSLDHQGPAPHEQGQTSATGTGGPTMAFLINRQTTHQPRHWPPHAEGSGAALPARPWDCLPPSPKSDQSHR